MQCMQLQIVGAHPWIVFCCMIILQFIFIHFTCVGNLGSFQLGMVRNNADINVVTCLLIKRCIFSIEYIPRNKVAKSQGGKVFQSGCTNFHFHQHGSFSQQWLLTRCIPVCPCLFPQQQWLPGSLASYLPLELGKLRQENSGEDRLISAVSEENVNAKAYFLKQ